MVVFAVWNGVEEVLKHAFLKVISSTFLATLAIADHHLLLRHHHRCCSVHLSVLLLHSLTITILLLGWWLISLHGLHGLHRLHRLHGWHG